MLSLNTKYEKLNKRQATQLKNILMVHGNGVSVVAKTGLNINTIKRAAEGLRVADITADVLQNFLAEMDHQLNNNPE